MSDNNENISIEATTASFSALSSKAWSTSAQETSAAGTPPPPPAPALLKGSPARSLQLIKSGASTPQSTPPPLSPMKDNSVKRTPTRNPLSHIRSPSGSDSPYKGPSGSPYKQTTRGQKGTPQKASIVMLADKDTNVEREDGAEKEIEGKAGDERVPTQQEESTETARAFSSPRPQDTPADDSIERKRSLLLQTHRKKVLCKWEFQGDPEQEQLSFSAGDIIYIIEMDAELDWWFGELNGKEGYFPKGYTELIKRTLRIDRSKVAPTIRSAQQLLQLCEHHIDF